MPKTNGCHIHKPLTHDRIPAQQRQIQETAKYPCSQINDLSIITLFRKILLYHMDQSVTECLGILFFLQRRPFILFSVPVMQKHNDNRTVPIFSDDSRFFPFFLPFLSTERSGKNPVKEVILHRMASDLQQLFISDLLTCFLFPVFNLFL